LWIFPADGSYFPEAMQPAVEGVFCLGIFNLAGVEVGLILCLVLIMFGAKRLPEIARGLWRGVDEFRKACRKVTDEVNDAATDAGKSVGGIYGKPAYEALSPENQTAELYDPAAVRKKDRQKGDERVSWCWQVWRRVWGWLGSLLSASWLSK
jgi:sec-independent protein translocase protein TatA